LFLIEKYKKSNILILLFKGKETNFKPHKELFKIACRYMASTATNQKNEI